MRTFTLLALAATIGACDEGLQIPETAPRVDTLRISTVDSIPFPVFNRYGIEAFDTLNNLVIRYPEEADNFLQWTLPIVVDTVYHTEVDTIYVNDEIVVVRLYCYLKEPHHDSYVCQGSPR